ncbi:MAG TPA: hypothetical protein VKW04_18180 [Planctomycetota bacterium]|nr:hypothetical protein [Planctomycetota bacterium]
MCRWCRSAIAGRRIDAKYCSRKCRQAAWRALHYSSRGDPPATDDTSSVDGRPLRFAYADPPYPGLSSKYYRREPSFAGEVDHASLLDRLATFDGWALSTSARALREILPLCPREARVCAWVKPGGAPPATFGLHNVWEAVVVLQGRRLRPGRRDALYIHPARFGGELPGRKPLKFCAWLFDAMGMLPGDDLVDMFPGTGIVSRAWEAVARGRAPAPATDPSPGSASSSGRRIRRPGPPEASGDTCRPGPGRRIVIARGPGSSYTPGVR